jgi:hypothetical protein
MKAKTVFLLAMLLLTLSGCLAGPNSVEDVANAAGDVAGFWEGLWHGLIAVVTWVLSLFLDSVNIYEVHNSGGWYDFGFMLGIGAFGSGASKAGKRRKENE